MVRQLIFQRSMNMEGAKSKATRYPYCQWVDVRWWETYQESVHLIPKYCIGSTNLGRGTAKWRGKWILSLGDDSMFPASQFCRIKTLGPAGFPVVAGRCDVLRTLFWAATIVHWRIPHFYLMHRALHPWRTENDTSGSRSRSDPNGLRIEAINLWIIIDEWYEWT